MGKKFNQFLRNAAKLGIDVGDINQASAIFTGQDPNAAALPDVPLPPQIQALQSPLEIEGANRSRLTSQSRSRKRRTQARRGKKQLTTGLNTGAVTGGQQGGISF